MWLLLYIYMFVHGYIIAHMANYQFNVSDSTIKNYVNIGIDVFCDRDKLFYKYIYIPTKGDL
jgi:hypothetical protein